MSTKPEKIVFLRRKTSFIEESNTDSAVQEYFDMAYKAIGSYYSEFGKQYGSGLTREESQVLMPELTGADPDVDKRDFRGAVDSYFRNINTKIPPSGVKLNISLEAPDVPLISRDKDQKITRVNLPVKIRDYVIWKHALSHPEVGINREEAAKYDHIRFYVEDHEEVVKEASGLNAKEDKAFLQYHEIIEDADKVDHMLTMLGVDHRKMKANEKHPALKSFATINPNLGSIYNEQALDKFIALSSDKRLHTKFLIEEMITYNVLERVGQRILIKETSDEIGKDLKSTALWFEDKANTKDVNILNSRYKEFKKP